MLPKEAIENVENFKKIEHEKWWKSEFKVFNGYSGTQKIRIKKMD